MSQERTHRKQDDKYFDNLKKMSEEFNLSDKGKTTITAPDGGLITFGFEIFKGEDVREFIRLLKEEMIKMKLNIVNKKIDKLAGDKLTK